MRYRLLLAILLLSSVSTLPTSAQDNTDYSIVSSELMTLAENKGWIKVIVSLDVATQPITALDEDNVTSQQQRILNAKQDVVNYVQAQEVAFRADNTYTYVAAFAAWVSPESLSALSNAPGVVSVVEDRQNRTNLDDSVPFIGGDDVFNAGVEGGLWHVAVFDTGVQADHPHFVDATGTNDRISQAGCFNTDDSDAGISSRCPNGQDDVGLDASLAADCEAGVASGCEHGTHVAGIAASSDSRLRGVAPGAMLMAFNVFSLENDAAGCSPDSAPCVTAFDSDIMDALERIIYLRVFSNYKIAAVNMSLGSEQFNGHCDAANEDLTELVNGLTSLDVAVISSSGNDSWSDHIGWPACISNVVSVGNVDISDNVWPSSNVNSTLDLFAPGGIAQLTNGAIRIEAAVPTDDTDTKSGTSMAAPHVAGAWALMRDVIERNNLSSNMTTVNSILSHLQSTGVTVNDQRVGGLHSAQRIRIDHAVLPLMSNEAAINILDNTVAQPYPAIETRSFQNNNQLDGVIDRVEVELIGLWHPNPEDLDILLVSPWGLGVPLMSDACGDIPFAGNVTFESFNSPMPENPTQECQSRDYAISNYGAPESWPLDIDVVSSLDDLRFTDPNGEWKLYIRDDSADSPEFEGLLVDWNVNITTVDPDIIVSGSSYSTGNPYPDTISRSGVSGVVEDITVVLESVAHSRPQDMDILLQAPSGQAVMLMSDACADAVPTAFDLSIRSNATNWMPQTGNCDGVYAASNYDETEVFNDLGGNPISFNPDATLQDLRGTNPNGEWKLWILDDDDSAGNGFILDWRLILTTQDGAVTINNGGEAQPYPATLTITDQGGPIPPSGPTVYLDGVVHDKPEDLDILLVSPEGTAVMLMSDTCAGATLEAVYLTFMNAGDSFMGAPNNCGTGRYYASNVDDGIADRFGAGVPSGPYSNQLTDFAGEDPNGTWELYVVDDDPATSSGSIYDWNLGIGNLAEISVIQGETEPYPASINFTEPATNTIDTLTVSLQGITHVDFSDYDILLHGPYGRHVVLMSDACQDTPPGTRLNLTFSADASEMLPQGTCRSGTYLPTNYDTDDNIPAPLNWSEPYYDIDYDATLETFDGMISQGSWSLYVHSERTGSYSAWIEDWDLSFEFHPRTALLRGITDYDGPAQPYPLTYEVTDSSGPITDMTVVLEEMHHTYPDDLDILLEGPNGQTVVLMSDACGNADLATATAPTFQFNDARGGLRDEDSCTGGGTFHPTNYDNNDTWPSPAPSGPHATDLSVFNGMSPGGIWKLYIVDDKPEDGGFLNDFRINFVTADVAVTIGETAGLNSATPYPSEYFTFPTEDLIIEDISVTLEGVYHNYPDDLDILLVSPQGVGVVLMSDVCGQNDLNTVTFTFSLDPELADPLPDDEIPCESGTYLPTNASDFLEPNGDSWTAPAPAGPYGTSLSDFIGLDHFGTWELYVVDDYAGNSGFITDWSLSIQKRPPSADVNGDGAVTPADALYVINRVGDHTERSADVNGDARVDENDVDYIIERLGETSN